MTIDSKVKLSRFCKHKYIHQQWFWDHRVGWKKTGLWKTWVWKGLSWAELLCPTLLASIIIVLYRTAVRPGSPNRYITITAFSILPGTNTGNWVTQRHKATRTLKETNPILIKVFSGYADIEIHIFLYTKLICAKMNLHNNNA